MITNFNNFKKDLDEIKDIQSSEADNGDAYNVGLFNGLELATSLLNGEEPKYKDIKIIEDKIYSFSDYNSIKYNGNLLVNQIMEWLRAKLLDTQDKTTITVPLETFFNECSVDKDKFMTFYNEHKQTQKIQSFDINIDKNKNITFNNFRKEKVEETKK